MMTESDKALVERLRSRVSNREMLLVDPPRPAPDRDCHYAADRIEALSAQLHTVLDREAETHRRHDAKVEALSAENERLIKSGDGDVGLIHWQGERIEKLEAALREIARLRTDLSGDFSLGSKQSDIARAALGETK